MNIFGYVTDLLIIIMLTDRVNYACSGVITVVLLFNPNI